MLATCDSNLDENPQVVAANFGSGDDRFVIGWHSVRDGSSDIQLLAVDGSGTNQVQAAIQATRYDDEKPEVIGGVTVPGEETILYTATSNFITDAVAVEQIGVDYATLALNSLTPIRFTIRNTGLNDVTNLTVKLGSGETATLTEKLLPNESTTLTVWHHVEDHVTDPRYTITADGINEEGKVYLDYPDIGISQMEVIAESAGKRTVRMTLYNSSAATLAGGRNREVKLAVYADDLHTKPAEVACTTNGVSVSGNEITVSGDSSNLPLWSALLLASTLALAGAVHLKRKRAR